MDYDYDKMEEMIAEAQMNTPLKVESKYDPYLDYQREEMRLIRARANISNIIDPNFTKEFFN